jgi:hypothetical protein
MPDIQIVSNAFDFWEKVLGFGLSFIGIISFISLVAYQFLRQRFVTPKQLQIHCDQSQKGCKPLLCGKLEQVRREISAMDKKRATARDEHTRQLNEIHKFMGRVEQFMEDIEKRIQ